MKIRGWKKRAACVLVGGMLAGAVFTGKAVWASDSGGEKITLHMMHYWGDTDADVSSKYLKEILENEFSEAFPEVELIQETCDNETYKEKVRVLMASGETPDILFSYGAGFMQNYVEAGKFLALDDYLDDFYKEHLDMEAQENFIFDGKLYGACCTTWKGVLYCNKELFEKAGAEFPETYDELVTACEKLRQSGTEPIALGMMNKWQGQQWINNFTIQLGGAQLYKDMASGKESMDNEVMEKAVSLTENLIDHDVFSSNMYQMVSGEAESSFLNGEAAMIYIGSWFTEAAEESLGDKLEVIKMPEVEGAQYPSDYHGGGINGFAVSADTEYPETAANVVAWISYRLSCYQPANSAFLLEEGDQEQEMSRTEQKILKLYENKDAGGAAWDTLMVPARADTWLNLCADLFGKKTDARGFMEDVVQQLG